MSLRPWQVVLALLGSLALHLGAGVFAFSSEDVPELSGGGAQLHADIGSAFETVIQAGDPAVQPVAASKPETQTPEAPNPLTPVTAPATEPSLQQADITPPIAPEAVQLQVQSPTQPAVQPMPVAEAIPVVEAATHALTAVPAPPPVNPIEQAETAAVQSPPEPVRPVTVTATAQPEQPRKPAAKTTKTEKPANSPPKTAKKPDPEPKKARVTETAKGGAGGKSNATATAGGAGRVASGDSEGNAEVSNYPGQISRALRRALYYPPSAKRRRMTGEAIVSFVVSKSGAAGSLRIARSSGHPQLDEAALETVRRAAPFPAIPTAARRDSWTFTIPIAFR